MSRIGKNPIDIPDGVNIDLNKTSIDLFNIARKRDKNICLSSTGKSSTSAKSVPYDFFLLSLHPVFSNSLLLI